MSFAAAAAAQHVHAAADSAPAGAPRLHVAAGAHAVPLLTHASPILRGASRTEAYLSQPTLLFDVVFARDVGDVRAHGAPPVSGAGSVSPTVGVLGTISLEALTMARGELAAGSHGEGYVDRRHPHTYLHELMAFAMAGAGPVVASLAAGRGFVPFGTDDPMMRPFVKFPVNHHLGQVLERLVAAGGVRASRVMVEGALFDGAEPFDATDLGSTDRFGDSWAARLTVLPVHGLELQASRAFVESPEMPHGGGWDQRKWSASARWDAPALYALAEWKRTTMLSAGRDIFAFGSVLAEAELRRGAWRPALRVERSERPEEERLFDPFRSPWPHGGGHVLGITRWTIVSARLQRDIAWRHGMLAPFIEASYSRVRETAGGLFDPAEFYGGTAIRTLNIGARLGAGAHRPRMGRYGVAAAAAAHTGNH
jgi:hypothetical protein